MKKDFVLKPHRDYDIKLSGGVVVRMRALNPNNSDPVTPLSISLLIEERKKHDNTK